MLIEKKNCPQKKFKGEATHIRYIETEGMADLQCHLSPAAVR